VSIVLAIALILQASFLAVGTPLPENLTHSTRGSA
jgi:hypothetical protein